MADESCEVVIVGAGGGGAVLGLALANHGVKTIVLEQAPGPPGGVRGEILQPNGQRVLDRLGLLQSLPSDAVRPVRYFHFQRAGGERLCTIDYGMLPPPYDRAIVTLPNAAHQVILDALERRAPGALRYKASFKRLRRDRGRIVGVEAEQNGRLVSIAAQVVVGADGAFSKVREALEIPTRLFLYREAYLIAILESPQDIPDGHYFVGRRTILGMFPMAGRKIYLFYMIPAGSMEQVKAGGLRALQEQWSRIAPDLSPAFRGLNHWGQTAYMPAARVRTTTWVADGAVLIGDAAHAMNPHASQGRMQAMLDAITVAEVIHNSLKQGHCSVEALSAFEHRRRFQVEMLQQLADEQVLFWNTGNPVLAFLRDRVFRTLGRNRRLRYRVLATTAGLCEAPPFGLVDRLIAAGFLPDFHADRLPPDALART